MNGGTCALPLRKLIAQTSAQLEAAHIDQPQQEAALLARAASQRACARDHVSMSDFRKWELFGESLASISRDDAAANSAAQWLEAAVTRRLTHEPLQYIIGTAPFMTIDVPVGPGVFVPRVETELMVASALDWLKGQAKENPVICDLCSGSGAIGLAIASDPQIHGTVIAVEKDEQAWDWLCRNIRAAQESGQLVSTLQAVRGDATSVKALSDFVGKVDCIICNPPYVPQDRPVEQPEARHDPAIALYGGSPDGMAIPRAIVAVAAQLLHDGGALLMEHDITQGLAMREAFSAAGFVGVATHEDDTHRPRWTQGVKGVIKAKA